VPALNEPVAEPPGPFHREEVIPLGRGSGPPHPLQDVAPDPAFQFRVPLDLVSAVLFRIFPRFSPKALRAFISRSSPGDDRTDAETELSSMFPDSFDPEIRRDPDLSHFLRLFS